MGKNSDVFFSYNVENSGELVKKIATDLENKGISCWYCQRDGKGLYAREIMSAIKQCRVFVLIVNEESLRSEDCLNEIELGFERLRQARKEGRDDFVLFSFKTQNINLMDYDAAYYIKRFSWIDATIPPIEDRIHLLINGVCEHILPTELSLTIKHESKLKSRFQYPKKSFVGREEILADIESLFSNDSHCVVLQGIGGIGKSEIAKFYAVNYKNKYDTVVFVPFKESIEQTIIDDSAVSINGVLHNPNENDNEYFDRKLNELLRTTDEKTLFVIDGFDNEFDKSWERFASGDYRILITSRNNSWHECYDVVSVSGFDNQGAFTLFEKYYGRSVKENDKTTLTKLFQQLAYHTLAIELCAKQMKASRIETDAMYSLLTQTGFYYDIKEKVKSGCAQENSEASEIIENLYNIADLSIAQKNILSALTLMPEKGILITLFVRLCGLNSYEEINNLINQSWIQLDEELDKVSLHPLILDVVKNNLHPSWKDSPLLIQGLDKMLELLKAETIDERIDELLDIIGIMTEEDPSLLYKISLEGLREIERYYDLSIERNAKILSELKSEQT